MGWTAPQFYQLTMSEFWAAWEGWAKAQAPAKPKPMTRAELDKYAREWDPNG